MRHPSDPVSFHNTAELVPTVGVQGHRLQRFPSAVCDAVGLNEGARLWQARKSPGCEIRFVTDAPRVAIYLSSPGNQGVVRICRSDYPWRGLLQLAPDIVQRFELENTGFGNTTSAAFAGSRFAPNLWRVVCGGGPVAYHGIETFGYPVRPPEPGEVPARRWLAYGSSITMAENIFDHYVETAANLLGVDSLNLGLAGACLLDACIADDIARRNDWDFCTMELGVNARGRMSDAEFEARARYLITRVTQAHPTKPVVLLTTFRNRKDYATDPEDDYTRQNEGFRVILRQLHEELGRPNLHGIEGTDLFVDHIGFQSDLLHPGALAFVRAGIRLAERLQSIL